MTKGRLFGRKNCTCKKENIRNAVESALLNDEFKVYYQPQYDYGTNAWCGVEALIRWHHPEKGLISPDDFIPELEENDCIYELDKMVWDRACCDFAELRALGIAPKYLSVNVSCADILKEDFEKVLMEIIARNAMNPGMMHLEITETAYVDDIKTLLEVVELLQKSGFVVEMDDFGTGYSTLKLLKHIPFDVVKIDMNFLHDCETNQKSRNILTSIINMLKKERISIVMEGVETEDQARLLKKFGCDFMQGYYFGKPMPKEKLKTALKSMVR